MGKFGDAVTKCVVKYSKWSFLTEIIEEKQSSELILNLNMIPKASSMISANDIKKICDECEIGVKTVRNVIGWYQILQPLIAQTKGSINEQMVIDWIRQVYTEFDLPFIAMQEADDDDIDHLSDDIGFNAAQKEYFKINLASQLKLSRIMTAAN